MIIMDAIELPLPSSAINSNPKAVLSNLPSRAVGSSENRVSDGTDASISVRNRDSASTSSRTDSKFPVLPTSHRKPDFSIPPKSGIPNPNSKPDFQIPPKSMTPNPTFPIPPKSMTPNPSSNPIPPKSGISNPFSTPSKSGISNPIPKPDFPKSGIPNPTSKPDFPKSGIPNPTSKPDFQIPPKSGISNPNSLSRRDPTGMILSLPKQDASKSVHKRSVKLINILPPNPNKRPKMEQIEGPVSADFEESARISKQRRCEKRGERKAVRSVRSKFDFSVNKSGLVGYDSTLGGSSILGMYGLKIDMHDITKNEADLPLKELLEGSRIFYRNSSTNRDNKGKKSLCSKEELILSVRKAHSLFPVRTDRKESDDKDIKIRACDKDKPTFLSKNSSQMDPKQVLAHLSLNQDQTLNSTLISINPTQIPSLNATSLPSFHWSTPQSGPHKPSFDSVKVPWVKIGGNFTTSQKEESNNNNNNKPSSSLLDYLDKLEKEAICDEKLKGLCTESSFSKERGETHETASVSGQIIDVSKQGNYSTRAVQAAEILCEISRCSNLQPTSQKQTNGAIKWPNSPSLKTMKPSKPLPPFIKHENNNNNINNSNNNNTTTTNTNSNISNPSPSRNPDYYSPSRSLSKQHKLPSIDRQKKHENNNNNHNHNNNNNNNHTNNNSSKGSIKWPVPTLPSIPTDPKPSKGGNDKRPQNSTAFSSQARIERDYENQQRIRKATLTASLTGNPNPGNSNPGFPNPGNSNPGNPNPCFGDWKRNKRV